MDNWMNEFTQEQITAIWRHHETYQRAILDADIAYAEAIKIADQLLQALEDRARNQLWLSLALAEIDIGQLSLARIEKIAAQRGDESEGA